MKNKDKSPLNKIRVAVLYGGRSNEHEVSLASATNVIKNLDRSRYEVVPIGIDKLGFWYLGEDLGGILQDSDKKLQVRQEAEHKLFAPDNIGMQGSSISSLATKVDERLFDVVFPALHGPLCEDGTLQGLLELAEIPYVGCGVIASAIGMDKDVAKRLVKAAGIDVAAYVVIKQGQWNKRASDFYTLIEKELTYPVFVKPVNAGSSVGIHKVKSPEGLLAAVENAFLYDTKILVEQGISDILEIEISVLEAKDYGDEPIVSVAGEIRPQNGHEFYSYASKYLDEAGAAILIPAPVSAEIQAKLAAVAKTIFAALECEGMARIDLFLEKNTGRVYFNEINSLPGFTQISMFPKLMAASGINYSDLLTHLIELAMARHARQARLSREYIPEDELTCAE